MPSEEAKGGGSMATFTVTYADGECERIEADRYCQEGAWLVFTTGRDDEVIVSAGSVRRVDRTGIMLAPRFPAAVALAGIAVFSIWVGLADTFGAETESGRLLGLILAVAGVACVVAAHGLAAGTERGLRWGIIGAVAAAAVAVFLIAAQVRGAGREFLLPAVLIVGASIATAQGIKLWRRGVRPPLPSLAESLVALGILAGLFQVWYDKEYLPAAREGGLSEDVALEAGPVRSGGTLPEFVTAIVTLKNVSGTKVRFAGSHYTAWNFDPMEDDQAAFITSGRLGLPVGGWLGPDEEIRQRIHVLLPDGALPGVRFEVAVHVTQGDRIPHGYRVECKQDDDCPSAWEIGEDSLVHRLTREPRYLVLLPYNEEVPVAGSSGSAARMTHLVTCISREPDSCPPGDDLNHVYGRVVIRASDSVVLDASTRPGGNALTGVASGSLRSG